MMQNHHWAHQEPPASEDFFTPGVKWDRRHRPTTAAVHPDDDDYLAAITGAVPPTSPIKIQRVQQDPSQTIAKWLNKDHELAQTKLKEWVEKKQRELMSASPGARQHPPPEAASLNIPRSRKRQSVPTTPKKQSHTSTTASTIPLVSPPNSAHHRAFPSTAPTTPSKPSLTSPKPPKTPHNPAESQAAYVEWLNRKSADLDRAATERARQESERAALRAAASALAKQRYDEWKATRKAPAPPARPKLHQFPMVPPAYAAHDVQREPRVTFADVFGDIAFHSGTLSDASQGTPASKLSASGRSTSTPRLAFGRPISSSASTFAPAPPKRATSTASDAHDPPHLLSPPGMFAELERMQRHYPAYLKRFPGHVAHAGASVGKVWIDPSESVREQAAAAAKWARLNAAVGCYCHDQGKAEGQGQGLDVEEVGADLDKNRCARPEDGRVRDGEEGGKPVGGLAK